MNVFSQYWTVMEFLPRMISLGRGHITSICSMAGVTGTPNLVPYCSSKFAVKGFMDALYLEMRATRPDCKVGFTTILPFVVDTGQYILVTSICYVDPDSWLYLRLSLL